VGASRVGTASLLLLIARREGGWLRRARRAGVAERAGDERCDPFARSGSVPGGPSRGAGRAGRLPFGQCGRLAAGGGPEFGGASAGGDLGGGDAAGGVQGVEGGLDLAGGLVVVERLADLAAGQPARMVVEGGVDLLGERIAGRAGQRPGGRPSGVVLERERGLQVRGADLAFAVGEGVDEREPDDVRLGAGGDLRDDLVLRFGRELAVGVMPQFTRVGVQADVAGCACLVQGGGEQAIETGALQRVGITALGQQSLPAAGDQQQAVAMPTSALRLM